jgi:hypothetical protein
MPQKIKYKSKDSAIETLKRLFSNSPNEDIVTLDEAFIAAGRDPEKKDDNKAWISNKLTTLKYHNLLLVHYSYDTGHRKLDKLQLTLEGKRALGRIDEPIKQENHVSINDTPSIGDVMKIVAQLRKTNPDYEITFDVKLKSV